MKCIIGVTAVENRLICQTEMRWGFSSSLRLSPIDISQTSGPSILNCCPLSVIPPLWVACWLRPLRWCHPWLTSASSLRATKQIVSKREKRWIRLTNRLLDADGSTFLWMTPSVCGSFTHRWIHIGGRSCCGACSAVPCLPANRTENEAYKCETVVNGGQLMTMAADRIICMQQRFKDHLPNRSHSRLIFNRLLKYDKSYSAIRIWLPLSPFWEVRTVSSTTDESQS